MHKVVHLFIAFTDMKKNPSLPMSSLATIDTGLDATNSLIRFFKFIKKDPIACTGLSLDGDGTNMGCHKGVAGRVTFSYSFCLLASVINCITAYI